MPLHLGLTLLHLYRRPPMQIEVQNPPGYDAAAMARKFIEAIAGCSLAEYVARIEREQKEGVTSDA